MGPPTLKPYSFFDDGGSATPCASRSFSNGDFAVDLTHQVYDVTPDGRHFVMVRSQGGTSHLAVTLNLFQNLGLSSSGPVPEARTP